jgi:hypothetical protein
MSTEPDLINQSTDSSPYIRTYAKDFAALAAKNPGAAAVPNIPTKSKPPKEPKKKPWRLTKAKVPTQPISQLDSIANDLDAQTLESPAQGIPRPNEHAEEPFALPKLDQGDIVMPQPKEFAPPAYATPTTFAEPIPAYKLAENEDRAAILTRLKERVATHQLETPAQPIVPVIPVSPPETASAREVLPIEPLPIKEVAPTQVLPGQEPQPATVLPQASGIREIPPPSTAYVLPSPPVIPAIPVPQETSSPIHTYTSDFADRIDTQHASQFSVLAAETDVPAPRIPQSQTRRRRSSFVPILIGIILLILGAGAAVGAFMYVTKNTPTPITLGPSSLITPDQRVQLTGTGSTLLEALADKASQPLASGDVLLTYVNEATTTSEGTVEQQATGGAFITELKLPAPDILLRSIQPTSMVGIVHAGNETRPFFILRVDSYERSFAGMLQWEPTIYDELTPLYPLYPASAPQTNVNSTSASATSSQIFIPPAATNVPTTQFIDETVSNHSARALKDSSGRTLLIYGYADEQTLIIARDETAFIFLLGRLAANNS